MASLTIGGQTRELHFTVTDLRQAESEIMKRGGRPILAVFLGNDRGFFGIAELDWLIAMTWKRAFGLSEERTQALLAQFYQEGGSLPEIHTEVIQALIDSGLIAPRPNANGGSARPDPPGARASG